MIPHCTPGAIREPVEWALCAEVDCDEDADLEVLHAPGDDGGRIWVPLCEPHYRRTPRFGLQYVVEVSGFVRRWPEQTAAESGG